MASEGASPLLEISGLSVRYPGLRVPGSRSAVHGVDLVVHPGESVGVVGASGAGKSTVARTIIGELQPARGMVRFAGRDLFAGPRWLADRRRAAMRLVVHDGYAALAPIARSPRSSGSNSLPGAGATGPT
jgi:ABC-type glutathione transport system ATPase component